MYLPRFSEVKLTIVYLIVSKKLASSVVVIGLLALVQLIIPVVGEEASLITLI